MIVTSDLFTQAVNFVLKAEGGYSVDPVPTNQGIEQAEYDAYRKGLTESPQSVRNITAVEAVAIYRKNYWEQAVAVAGPLQLLTLFMFDTGVNMGNGAAVKLLQSVVNTFVDGSWGPHSRQMLEMYLAKQDEMALVGHLADARRLRYRELGTQIGNRQYLEGWLNRVDALMAMVKTRYDASVVKTQ